MLFGNRNGKKECVNIIGIELMAMTRTRTRNPGLYLDNDLRFDEHINRIIKSAFTNLKMIYSNKHYFTSAVNKTMCDALVLSHLNYCLVVYGYCLTKSNQPRLQRIIISCTRVVLHSSRQPVSSRIMEIKWMNFKVLLFYHSCYVYYKVLIYKFSPYLVNRIRYRIDVHFVNIRRKQLLSVPHHCSALFQRSFSYNVCRVINRIPGKFFSLSFLSFKNRLKFCVLQKTLPFLSICLPFSGVHI